jgi:hypothetical protein
MGSVGGSTSRFPAAKWKREQPKRMARLEPTKFIKMAKNFAAGK